MKAKEATGVRFWAIEHARSPSPRGTQGSGLLCMPLPWDEDETIRAAVMVYESRPLAEAGLGHYLAWTGQEPASYSLVGLPAEELAEILEGSPEGFDRVAMNPIVSLHFPEAESYSAGLRAEEFVAELKSLSLWLGTLLVKMSVGASMGRFLSALGESAPVWM
jgi:hypothetical protein